MAVYHLDWLSAHCKLFFAENHHLLMLYHFDEHEQNFLDGYETEALKFLTHGLTVQFERFNRLPQLRYRFPCRPLGNTLTGT